MAILHIFAILTALIFKCTKAQSCTSVRHGYQCQDRISHHLGQYSPWFSIHSEISNDIPEECHITFVQVLSRHGARYPTASKTITYNATIQQIKTNAKAFEGKYGFLKTYEYNLGADQLTPFGAQELVDSGAKFVNRYPTVTRGNTPFIRASGEQRVIDSATNFSLGYHNERGTMDNYPYPVLVIPEGDGYNNTLNHDLCDAFEEGPDSTIGSSAQAIWTSQFVPPIQTRVNNHLPGANLSTSQIISLMDLCPFDTVAGDGTISRFCHLFTAKEWQQYDYYQSLGKYYGYGSGNPLGPTQGVGFTNELISRMTKTPVMDRTSVNHTLDDSNSTFPLGIPLYADFSHDNDMTPAFAAMGLYNRTAPLLNTTYETTAQTNGYSAAWTVPFAARAYFEKMQCPGQDEELVRILVNDRVVPLVRCGADKLGRCKLSKWVSSLSFARSGGYWDQCF